MPMLRTYASPVDNRVTVTIPKEYADYSFQVILVPCNATPVRAVASDIHVFDSLHADWGGEGSATEIADELRAARRTDRLAAAW